MAATTAVAVLLLLALSVCVLAQQEELSLLDVTRGSKGTTVKPSSYGGYSVIQSCLELSQIKHCAVTGNICPPPGAPLPPCPCCPAPRRDSSDPCGVGRAAGPCDVTKLCDASGTGGGSPALTAQLPQCPSDAPPCPPPPPPPQCLDGPSGAYLGTDFTCCGDKHDYGYGSKTTLGETYINGRAATCTWQIDGLKENSPWRKQTTGQQPVDTVAGIPNTYVCLRDDSNSPHCKLGPVTGHCQWTDESDKCEGPYCHDMAMTIKGNLYATLAYSKERMNMLTAPMGDRCSLTADYFNTGLFPVTDPQAPGAQSALFWAGLTAAAQNELGPMLLQATGVACTAPAKPEETEHPAGYDYQHDYMYPGIAFIFMGETSISSIKSPLKVETTGHIEFTPVFKSDCTKKFPVEYKWPTVKGGMSKFWFKEEDKHHPEHRY